MCEYKFAEFERKPIDECPDIPQGFDFLKIVNVTIQKKEYLRASHWVGVSRTSDDEPITVTPKFQQFDPAEIFLKGLPYLSQRDEFQLNKLLKLDMRPGKLVNMPDELKNAWSFFLITAFVNQLKKVLERRPKKDYRWQIRNRTGVVKGRIRMQDHIRLNLSRGMPHRICSESLEYDQQTALNQILKKACLHASAGLSKLRNSEENADVKSISSELNTCIRLFGEVPPADRVNRQLINKAKAGLKGHYASYKTLLDYAISIIRNEYCRQNSKKNKRKEGTHKTVPFALNMNALFELHVRELFLGRNRCRTAGELDKKQPVFHEPNINGKSGPYSQREPDFVMEYNGMRILVECKYKQYNSKGDEEAKVDWLTKFKEDEKGKRLGEDRWENDPSFEVPRYGFFQTLAYVQLFQCGAGIIVYPKNGESEVLTGMLGANDTKKIPFVYFGIGESDVEKALEKALDYITNNK